MYGLNVLRIQTPLKKAACDGGWATVVLRVEHHERVAGSDARGGGGTRVDVQGRQSPTLSFHFLFPSENRTVDLSHEILSIGL